MTLLLVLLSLSGLQPQAATPAPCAGRDVRLECSKGACELVVEIVGKPGCRLRIDDGWLKAHAGDRITEDTALTIRVVGANLLRYGLKFETKEKVVDSYVDLEKLWKQALTFLPETRAVNVDPADTTPFVSAIKAWREELLKRDSELMAFLSRYKALTLACGDRDAIRAEASKTAGRLDRLESLRKTAADHARQTDDFPIYDSTLAAHEATVNRIKTFETRAVAAADGFARRVTFGEAGRIVTVTISLTDLAGGTDAGLVEVVEFFVHSTLPVTFHAGYSYSGLDAFEFEPVAAAAGEDLFAQINEGKNTSGMTAFLSYRFNSSRRAGSREWLVTLGTDLNNPGKTLFGGGTVRVKKIMLSAGIATAAVREAKEEDKITDVINGVGNALGTRELFTRIYTTRQWRPFIALSFAPF